MSARDVAQSALDREIDTLTVDARAADELFAVVDLLEAQPPLRRALSDPGASVEDRVALARRVLGSRISASAMSVLEKVVAGNLGDGLRLAAVLERQGIRSVLRAAQTAGTLQQVQSELHSFARTVERNHALSDALRNRAVPLEHRRALVSRLTTGKTSSTTSQLLSRATAARARTLPLTVDTYLELAADVAREQVARVTVAQPLDEQHVRRLRQALEAQVGGAVSLQIDVDPRVLGGMNIQLGENTIESTVAGRLNDARRLLNTSPSKVGRNG